MHRNVFIYVSIVLGALVISLDFASIDLALPALEAQFGLDLDGVQWVINGYVLAFAVLMVAGGNWPTPTAASGSSCLAWGCLPLRPCWEASLGVADR
jgi:MFS family permease